MHVYHAKKDYVTGSMIHGTFFVDSVLQSHILVAIWLRKMFEMSQEVLHLMPFLVQILDYRGSFTSLEHPHVASISRGLWSYFSQMQAKNIIRCVFPAFNSLFRKWITYYYIGKSFTVWLFSRQSLRFKRTYQTLVWRYCRSIWYKYAIMML